MDLKTLAAELGLSISTVSRALSGHPHVNETTRARVKSRADALGYRPDALARALRRTRTQTVGIILPDIANQGYADAAAVLQRLVGEKGYRLVFAITGNDPDMDRRCLEQMLEYRVDGIVHVPCTANGAMDVVDVASGPPLIEFFRHSVSRRFDAVVVDEHSGALKLTEHLIDLGHERIAIIVGPRQFSSTIDRISGVREAMVKAGLELLDKDVLVGEYTVEWGAMAFRNLMFRDERPTAVIAASHQLLLGVLMTARELRIAIPDDVSMASMGRPAWCQIVEPAITSFVWPTAELGLTTAQLLLARITLGTQHATPTLIRLSGSFTFGDSCGPPNRVASHAIARSGPIGK